MNSRYLEITFRDGVPIAAYFYLPRKQGDTSDRTQRFPDGLLVDYAFDGRPIGVEITAPSVFSLAALNHVLATIQQEPVSVKEVAPLAA